MFLTAAFAAAAASAAAFAVYRYLKKPTDHQMVGGVALPAGLLVMLVCWLFVRGVTSDTEYWTGYVTEATYREGWTEVRTVITTDSDGHLTTRTEIVNHSPEWHVFDTNGEWTSVEKETYLTITRKFGVAKPATGGWSGRKYEYEWDRRPETATVWTTRHRFRNPTLVGNSLFSYSDVPAKEVEARSLPPWTAFQWAPANGGPPGFSDRLAVLNADMGAAHKVRIHFVWAPVGEAEDWGHLLEAYWDGGKKNELTVVVGTVGDGTIVWCHVFGWSRSDSVKAAVRDCVNGQSKFDETQVMTCLRETIPGNWAPADFKEYDHLRARVPIWFALLMIAVVSGLSAWASWFVATGRHR